jgi:hypothetical protein
MVKTQPRFGSPQAPEPQDLDVPREVPGFREGLGRTPGRSSQEDPQPAEKGALLTSPLWLKPPKPTKIICKMCVLPAKMEMNPYMTGDDGSFRSKQWAA